jgi:feruloyl esterase
MHIAPPVILLITVGLAACSTQPQETSAVRRTDSSPGTGPVKCEDLKSAAIAHTTIHSATSVGAGAFTTAPNPIGPPADYSKLPAFCRVIGSIAPTPDSDIRFELWLPAENWNGKFVQTGNGGAAGAILYFPMAEPLARGYAVANTDTGHQGDDADFAWAVDHPEKLTDYAYRAVHELTIVGKALTTARYAMAPRKSYWDGCSTGGRQGLKEAQRFPDDYDAIIAGAPANNWSPLLALSISIQRSLESDGLGVDKLGILKEAAIAACDARDGVKDRVISNPRQCPFDPSVAQCKPGQAEGCLTSKEVAAAKRIYAGVVDKSGGVRIPGTGPASEPVWAAYASGFAIGTSYFRHVVARDPNWNPAAFDVDADLARAEQTDGGAHLAMDPDLSAFIGRNGKLLLYHGTTDGLIPYGNTVNYYNSVVDRLGADKVRDHVKLYLVPGMDHCYGGEGAFAIDWLTALEQWAENGKTPGALPAVHPADAPVPPNAPPSPGKSFTRPVCAYPYVATYNGRGDTTDAVNFLCVSS